MKLRVDEIKDAKGNIMFYSIGPENDLHRFTNVFPNEYIKVGAVEAKKYAQLFAIAPDMLGLLKEFLNTIDPLTPSQREWEEGVMVLIKKANTV